MTSYTIYGEEATDPKDINLNGQLWQQYDESGKIESVAFDFKGNLLSKKQFVISSATLKSALDNYTTYLVDWTGLPSILGTQEFETSSEFDALNRATKITLPEDVNTDRKEIVPTYNRAGALEKVDYDGTEYVNNIVYSAKGQRLLIAFGNDVMTRYAYDPRTFRLLRQRSEKYTYSLVSDTHTYTPATATNRQDDGFNFDLVGNIMKILIRVNDCGITGTTLGADALDREFSYDPLYRVTSGNGRESDTQNENDYLYSDAPAPGNPNANNVRAYTRQYSYDKIGNVQQVTQTGTNGFTRNFVYNTGVNTLQKIETGSSTLIQNFTYDAVGNQITAGTTRNYVWNAGNQLITYYNQAGMADPTIFTQYDYSGMNRVSKMVRTGTAGSPIYERTIYIDGIFEYHILENGTTYEKNYVHVMDDQSRIAMVRIGTPFPDDITDAITYNLEDQIGSSTVRLNTTGGVIDKEEYYPFGDSSLRTFTKKRYRFTGKERDSESGLYYYGARYYSPWTCRFVSVDQLSAKNPNVSSYAYVFNNPLKFNDPTGMIGEPVSDAPTDAILNIDVSNVVITPQDGGGTMPPNEFIAIFDKNGNKTSIQVSNLGGEQINYEHHHGGEHDGQTYVESLKTGEGTFISTSKFIEGYTHRTKVDYKQITGEFLLGIGPEKSLISGTPMNQEILDSPAYKIAFSKYMEATGGLKSQMVQGEFGLFGAAVSGSNMTAQMIGTANYNFYPLGDELLIMVTDSKSISSWTVNPFDGDEVNKQRSKSFLNKNEAEPKTTTYQTYIMLVNFKPNK